MNVRFGVYSVEILEIAAAARFPADIAAIKIRPGIAL